MRKVSFKGLKRMVRKGEQGMRLYIAGFGWCVLRGLHFVSEAGNNEVDWYFAFQRRPKFFAELFKIGGGTSELESLVLGEMNFVAIPVG